MAAAQIDPPEEGIASATPPGEGERRAQRGYGAQYQSSAAVIYAGLERGDLEWVGLADRGAGIADDLVLGIRGQVVGHQFKSSQFPDKFRLQTLLMGANGLIQPLASAWQSLNRTHSNSTVSICFVTNDYPSTTDTLVAGTPTHSAAFLAELETNQGRSLAEWRATRWQPFVDRLCTECGLDEPKFDQFFRTFRLVHGPAAHFVQSHRLPPESARLVREIARFLPQLVADPRDKDRWTRAELLQELGWRDSASTRHTHQFPVGAHVQRNMATEKALRDAIRSATSGFISLLGPPGSGKSTLLQTALEVEEALILVRYLAYVPGAGQGVGRGEAEDFLDDVSTQLKRSGLLGTRFRNESLGERREQFATLLRQAGERFQRDRVTTLIVVDGLDHVPREEKPQHSLLAELPLPAAIPEGVLFVLGTQRLDLDGLKPAIQDQAGTDGRKVPVSPLGREAVYRMADVLGLSSEIPRDKVFDLSRGHPLVTRYLIEALRDANARQREAILAGAITFQGDIETVYQSAWRGVRDDDEAKQVLGYIARSEGAMPLALLAKAVPEQAIDRALASTKHLLSEGAHGWSVFHNSFRLFILDQPRLRLGKPDPDYSLRVYRELAGLAKGAPADSPQRWLELRYRARAQEHAAVLALAQPARFRQQFAEGRSLSELQVDIRLAFASAKEIYDPTVVFRLLLARDELNRRWTALEYASAITEGLLAVGELDRAEAFAEEVGTTGYKVVDALLSAGEIERARAVFDKLEPLRQLLSASLQAHELEEVSSGLTEWAHRVIHFRDADQINQAIDRLSNAAVRSDHRQLPQSGQLADGLRFNVALAIVTSRPEADVEEIGRIFRIPTPWLPDLLVNAALRSAELGPSPLAMGLLRRATAHAGFASVANASRRSAALIATDHGDLEMARAIFDGLQVPAMATLDKEVGNDASEHLALAVLEHAQLAAMLGREVAEVPTSKREILRPLQLHANNIGTLLGKARIGAGSIPHGDVARAARMALAYLERARPSGGDEFYAVHQIAAATPILGTALIQAAALCGEDEFNAVLAEFESAFQAEGTNATRTNLRREVAVEIYRVNGNTDQASRRLEPLVSSLLEDTPEAQVDSLASLATAFARVGNLARARELMTRLHHETLGYALAPKKDPQYALWSELLMRANVADARRRPERVALIMRQLDGMMRTEGRSAAYRVASSLITEAAMADAGIGLTAAQTLVERGTIGWAGAIDALMIGAIKSRPEIAEACVATWCALALPYYAEPYYRESHLGDFIDAAVQAAAQGSIAGVVETLQQAIETEARAHERAELLARLQTAAQKRDVVEPSLNAATARWKAEAPPPRHSGSTPARYDGLTTLTELKDRLEQETGSELASYEVARAFNRLAINAGFAQAKGVFERWEPIHQDSRARSVLINLAIDEGQIHEARRLIQGYDAVTDERATWTAWTGGSTLRHFQDLVRLDGAAVHRPAYDNFLSSLIAGREMIVSVLLEIEDIFPVIAQTPDWPAIWDCLAEQLATTREHALGRPFDVDNQPRMSDEEMIAALFHWAMTIPLSELRRHVRVGALRLNGVPWGGPAFAQFVRLLLAGQEDEPAEALQLLLLDASNSLLQQLGNAIVALADHPDYAVAEPATMLAKRWGREAPTTAAELPAFYRLILEEHDEDFERPELTDPASGAMRIENPLGWTFPFPSLVELMATAQISSERIRHRCSMLIDQWGGLEVFGKPATDRLQANLGRLEMRLPFYRPHIAIAARALRHVAGELRRAGVIAPQKVPRLLYLMGFPASPLPVLSPAVRPAFVSKPRLDDSDWRSPDEKWLRGVEDDVRPLLAGDGTVIAEICRFHVRNVRRTYDQERIRAPSLEVNGREDLEGWYEALPRAVSVDGIRAMDREPAPTIVRRLSPSHMPEVPEFQLTMCPHWLRRLGWQSHRDSPHVFLDKSGNVVAKIAWWRDGGPVDVQDDVVWGEGTYVIVTPAGRAQIEAVAGPLAVLVNARRDFKPDYGDGEPSSRRASSTERR